jgi:hypothetical protein
MKEKKKGDELVPENIVLEVQNIKHVFKTFIIGSQEDLINGKES